MTVYVDDMYTTEMGVYGRMKMSHMIADSTDELLDMARKIGVSVRWIQHPGMWSEHFDIAISKRSAAIAAGAVQVTMRECSAMCVRRRHEGKLGSPADAIAWRDARVKGSKTA